MTGAESAAGDALASLDERGRRLVDFARRLVAQPSLPGEEQAVATSIADELRELGYRDVEVDDVGNVTGWLGEGPPRLMFNGHIDHVPPASMSDPYRASIVDGAAYGEHGAAIRGRGSCDMKANVAAGAYAAAFLDPATLSRGSYLFTADVQEEVDSPAGVPALLERGMRADFGLSGESTALEVSLGHRGKLQFDVVVEGRSSHASTPDEGVNAVYAALPFLRALEAMPQRLPSDERFGPATLTVTGISSDPEEDVAVVPSRCTIRVDRRYVPGETPESAQRELEQAVAEVAERTGTPAAVRLINVYPLMEIDAEHPLVSAGAASVEAVRGRPARIETWRFGVNATFMSAAGIPTIGIGPGNEDWAHTPEEHVPIAEVVDASRIYADLIERLCR